MADRVRLRAAQVIKSATAIGLYNRANPFGKDLLCEILPNIKREIKHHKAIPHQWAPDIYKKLAESNSQSAYALRCIMLTATRSNEGRGMCFSEIDEDEWTIPAERMKGGKPFTQVLSPAMFDLIDEVPKVSDRVFAGYGAKNDYVSCTAVSKQVQRLAGDDYTVHGMRSCFKDWCADNGVDDRVSEKALSHKDKDKVRAAYLRTEFLPQRRKLMDDWSRYLLGYKS
jgi:integrase